MITVDFDRETFVKLCETISEWGESARKDMESQYNGESARAEAKQRFESARKFLTVMLEEN